MTIFNYLYFTAIGASFVSALVIGIICRLQLKRGRINESKLKESAAHIGRTIVPATLLGFGGTVTAGDHPPHVVLLMTTITMVVLTLGAALVFYASTKQIRRKR